MNTDPNKEDNKQMMGEPKHFKIGASEMKHKQRLKQTRTQCIL